MSEVAQRTATPPGVLVPVPGLARTHSVDPQFEFTDPPLRVTLAFAATADRPTVVLTNPATAAGGPPGWARRPAPAEASGMVWISLLHHPLTASAALARHGDLPRGTVSPAKVYSGCPKETLPSGGSDAASWSLAQALAAGIVDSTGCQSGMKAECTLVG